MNRFLQVLMRWLFIGAVACLAGCREESADKPTPGGGPAHPAESYFVDASLQRGVDFVHDVGRVGTYFMPESLASGGALFDYDGDGDLDVYFINGEDREKTGSDKPTNRLFQQQSDGQFVDVTEVSGLGDPGFGMGVAVGDIDNDGDLDVYVSNYGPDRLFRNNGDGTFADITNQAGIANPAWGTSACFFDYDVDGWLDLVVTNYVDYYPGAICEDDSGQRDYCGPKDFEGTVDRLFHNLGPQAGGSDVSFEDVTVPAGIAPATGRGLGVACRDFNGDGRPDIYVNNDMQPNRLWIQQPDGTFRDEAMLRGVAFNRMGEAEASMGFALADFDNDANMDFFLTHFEFETCTLYLGQGEGQFRDATASSGLGPATLVFNSFGTSASDLDCDGDLDLVVVNGRVMRGRIVYESECPEFWKPYAQPNLMFFNDGTAKFQDYSRYGGPLTSIVENSRGLASGDVDNDGDIDFLICNEGGRGRLMINQVPRRGSWLLLQVLEPRLHRDAVGAAVSVSAKGRVFRREVTACASYCSSNDVRLHFGLADAQQYEEILVTWLDGQRERFPGGPANRQVVVKRGEGQPVADSTAR